MTKRVRDRCDEILSEAMQAAKKTGTFAFNAAAMKRLLRFGVTYSQTRYALLELVERGELTRTGTIYSYTRPAAPKEKA